MIHSTFVGEMGFYALACGIRLVQIESGREKAKRVAESVKTKRKGVHTKSEKRKRIFV